MVLEVRLAGRSAATRARKAGAPAAPLGAAKTKLAVWLARVALRVPLVVTGEPVTVKRLGRLRPTLLTVPLLMATPLMR